MLEGTHAEWRMRLDRCEIFALIEKIVDKVSILRKGVAQDGIENLQCHSDNFFQQGKVLQLQKKKFSMIFLQQKYLGNLITTQTQSSLLYYTANMKTTISKRSDVWRAISKDLSKIQQGRIRLDTVVFLYYDFFRAIRYMWFPDFWIVIMVTTWVILILWPF